MSRPASVLLCCRRCSNSSLKFPSPSSFLPLVGSWRLMFTSLPLLFGIVTWGCTFVRSSPSSVVSVILVSGCSLGKLCRSYISLVSEHISTILTLLLVMFSSVCHICSLVLHRCSISVLVVSGGKEKNILLSSTKLSRCCSKFMLPVGLLILHPGMSCL